MTANKTTPETSSRIARTVFARSSDWRGMALCRFIGIWLAGERSDLVRCMMPPMDFLDDTVSVRGPDEPDGTFLQNRATRGWLPPAPPPWPRRRPSGPACHSTTAAPVGAARIRVTAPASRLARMVERVNMAALPGALFAMAQLA